MYCVHVCQTLCTYVSFQFHWHVGQAQQVTLAMAMLWSRMRTLRLMHLQTAHSQQYTNTRVCTYRVVGKCQICQNVFLEFQVTLRRNVCMCIHFCVQCRLVKMRNFALQQFPLYDMYTLQFYHVALARIRSELKHVPLTSITYCVHVCISPFQHAPGRGLHRQY